MKLETKTEEPRMILRNNLSQYSGEVLDIIKILRKKNKELKNFTNVSIIFNDYIIKTIPKKLLLKFFPKIDVTKVSHFIKETDGFSGAYFKEVFIFANLHECTIDKAISSIKNQLELYKKYGDMGYLG